MKWNLTEYVVVVLHHLCILRGMRTENVLAQQNSSLVLFIILKWNIFSMQWYIYPNTVLLCCWILVHNVINSQSQLTMASSLSNFSIPSKLFFIIKPNSMNRLMQITLLQKSSFQVYSLESWQWAPFQILLSQQTFVQENQLDKLVSVITLLQNSFCKFITL